MPVIGSGMGAVWDYVREQFADDVSGDMEEVQVSLLDKQIIPVNPRRWSILLFNTSTSVIHLRILKPLGTTNGIVLTPGGGFVGFDARNDMILPILNIYGRADVNPGTLDVLQIGQLL